jgi:RNA polymerase sigma-70 factor (ECF subfamily)
VSVAGSLRSLDPRDNPHDAAIRRDGARRWATLLATLPDRYRTPVVLRHVDGLSYDEMATVLGRPEGTIKAQVHRGLAQLRAAAEEAARGELEEMTA